MENGILPSDGDLAIAPEALIISESDPTKVLRVNTKEKDTIDGAKMLAAALQMFNAADIMSKVKKGAEYIVQIPAEYQEQLRSGALEMMHGDKSGKTWATIVRKLANGKQKIVANCPITEQMRYQGNTIQGMTNTYQNLYMQQKLAELSEQIKDVYDVVLRIEQGQMDDRIGKLLSGRNDLQLALKNPDDAGRKREAELARSKISEAQSQIGQVFKSRIEAFEAIPEARWKKRMSEVFSLRTRYMMQKNEEFNKLQEYFAFYLRATQLLAWSFTVVNDSERAETVFKQAIDHLRTIDFSKVQTLDYIYPANTMEDAFYKQSASYLHAEQELCLDEAKPYEFIQLTFSHEDLKEAINNGETL